MEDKGVKRQDGAIGSHLPLSEAHNHPKERVELNCDQKYNWFRQKNETWVQEVGLTEIPLLNYLKGYEVRKSQLFLFILLTFSCLQSYPDRLISFKKLLLLFIFDLFYVFFLFLHLLFMLFLLYFHFHFGFRNIQVIGPPHIFPVSPRIILLQIFLFYFPSLLSSQLNKLKLSFLKKVKEVVYRKEHSQKVKNDEATCI